ncbi:hypothetical protein B0T17DRAFT_491922 [Bombardia bombarda]|uniref:Uncharacterized protein n=1 Tax=Bombardia bombarda TaxID=252184 RepID=A0AA39X123_9PEZI|nr:hypothetical protein B0T17DRAFT_491922 [Bombardia bombarda]
MAAVVASTVGFVRAANNANNARNAASPARNKTKFFGSQIGGKSVINYSYTDLPWKLMAYDLYYFFTFIWALPHVLIPLTPSDSGHLAELSLTLQNVLCIVVHFVLCILQLAFLVSLPLMVLLPIWTAAVVVGLFMLLNHGLCMLLNGPSSQVEYHSDPKYAPELPKHAHEQWIFINGVAAGEHWLQSNLDRLAITFKRPILGIHNKTNGIIFDVIECLVQRNLGYATTDVRVCYRIIKEKLYNPQYSKVIFVLHSQGAIEGSMVLDWLLQELPQDLLAKLEVYTFGCAANHFNNPHRHIYSQDKAFRHPLAASTDSTNVGEAVAPAEDAAPIIRQPQPNHGNGSAPRPSNAVPTEMDNATSPSLSSNTSSTFSLVSSSTNTNTNNIHTSTNGNSNTNLSNTANPSDNHHPSVSTETTSHHPTSVSDRAIGHIEHYAHTTDFVALWGVLHFATSAPASQSSNLPRFIGRVFARTSARGGHQFCQHYLDGMFPLERDVASGEFVGCLDEGVDGGNEFMESEVTVGVEGDEMENAREAMGVSWLGDRGPYDGDLGGGVEIHGGSPILRRGRRGRRREDGEGEEDGERKVRVKELSRLWLYRNGRSPEDKPPLLGRGADGVVRMATI